ncbi:hypothetical protein Ccar_16360 [Clostridium carboxidivorans P7]|uniref:DUF4085 domain-containing protein n=1 Tax=Clostridium carboxidivorans P7 TaxID=536227 RepID=C6PSZ2_9CLOT|nr:DUF4085 family protein [Clostridium carboxidivorans]AKN32350.1 hypothetical protein Ccar_16360 [Clostridium carboxidivorans P7]EET87627.1 hypothetical protein CcarbDRAFT_1909 [Clostridium carboxidivorans P7]
MNYFTKEWYELCQKTSIHFPLKAMKEAESFSEEYFQQLYKQELAEWLRLQEEIALHKEKLGAVKESCISCEPFDREKLSQQFYQGFIHRQRYIKTILPEEILKEIADIRVCALDKASHKVIQAITLFCKNNEKLVNKTIKKYEKYYKKASKSFDRRIVENINFHDCGIIDVRQTEQYLLILFDNKYGFTDIDEIKFENYNIIKQDALLQNSRWLYDEMYKINDKYELHVLLQNKKMDLIDFIISADNITFRH